MPIPMNTIDIWVKQVAAIVSKIAANSGGQMSLTDVFCAVNRARGLEVFIPTDILPR